MRVLFISPTFFDDVSAIGGAERYVWELARAMTRLADVTVLTFGPARLVEERDGVVIWQLRRRPLMDHPLASNPLSASFFRAVAGADVVHCYQVDTFATAAGLVVGRLMRKPVFVTDLGGGHVYSPANYLSILRMASGLLLVSDYSRSLWQQSPQSRRPGRAGTLDKLDVIYGGVDTTHFTPGGSKDPDMVLYAGRLLPHKGIEHLIDAVEPPMRLHVVGRAYDQEYLRMLKARTAGKTVVFEHDVDDDGLVERYRRAFVSVLPSLPTDFRGQTTPVAELFGLVVIEAMACGTPVIVSRTTSLPELVDDGRTGWIVPPADSVTLGRRLRELHANPSLGATMGRAARATVLERYQWSAAAQRSMAAYRAACRQGVTG